MERLTANDAAFLDLEDEVSAMHSVTVATFEGPEPPADELARRVAERTAAVPRLRQRLAEVPLDLARPLWIDDTEFDLDYHLRHTGLPSDPTTGDLANLVGRLLSQRLDRGKPLWELWIVSGLPDDRWAIISKVHYALVDGVSGADPLSMVIDQIRGVRSPKPWIPRPRPSQRRLLSDAAATLVLDPFEQWRFVRRTFVDPIRSAAAHVTAGDDRGPFEGLTGAVGPHRRWHRITVDAADIAQLRDRHEVATNDVVLALITLGFRAMLATRDEPIPTSIRTLAPLAMATGDHFTNEISALEADLPVGEADFDDVVRLIHEQTHHLSGTAKAVAGATLAELPGLVAPTLCGLGLRAATTVGARLSDVQTVTVNAPGPGHEISVLDRQMVELYPAMPLVSRVRVAVGVMSYRGRFGFGVTGDRDAGLEIAAMANEIGRAAREAVVPL
ncbi:MAG: wax ester/triacylglycerol synthase domain-containing protein [Acidimicrobiales bacterium]